MDLGVSEPVGKAAASSENKPKKARLEDGPSCVSSTSSGARASAASSSSSSLPAENALGEERALASGGRGNLDDATSLGTSATAPFSQIEESLTDKNSKQQKTARARNGKT